jgi:hypothetical protein
MSLFATGYRGTDRNTFKTLGQVNEGWGVCSFTSTVYAMYARRPAERGMLINATRHYTVLATIKTFLTLLQASGENKLLGEIVNFTQSFGGDFADFTIEDYIKRVNEAEGMENIENDSRFGIGMPPNAVVKYLETWGLEGRARRVKNFFSDLGGNAIIGVRKPSSVNPHLLQYDGLCHWMYRHNGRIYSWGREFNSVKAANKNYRVNWVIEIHEPRR